MANIVTYKKEQRFLKFYLRENGCTANGSLANG